MNIINEGEIVINDKTRTGEVAQIMVTAGLYDATEDVPVYENDGTTPKEAGVSIHEVYGNIDTALQEVADKCKEAGIILNGQVCYSGDYYGRYYITDNVVEDLTADEIGVREASNEELIAELKRRGLAVTVQKNQLSESEKSADLPALCAYDIKWDTDGDAKVFNGLPERMFIPKELVDNDVISDYLSDEIGYCHAGFKIGIMFRGSILPYYTNIGGKIMNKYSLCIEWQFNGQYENWEMLVISDDSKEYVKNVIKNYQANNHIEFASPIELMDAICGEYGWKWQDLEHDIHIKF